MMLRTTWTDVARAVRFETVRTRASRPLRWVAAIGFVTHVVATFAVAAYLAFDPTVTTAFPAIDVATLVITGPTVLALTAAVIGVLVGGADYRHAAADLTFLVSPRRRAALAAKVAVSALIAAAVTAAGALVAAAALWGLYAPVREEAIGAGIVLAVVAMQMVKVVLWATVGTLAAVAARSQTVAGIAVVTISFVVEPMARSVVLLSPEGWWAQVPKVLPFTAINGVTGSGSGAGGPVFGTSTLPAGWSLLVALAWVALFALLADRSLWRHRSAVPPPGGAHLVGAVT